jgi:hypothetical protein
VLGLKKHQPVEVLLKFVYLLVFYMVSGAVVLLGFVKAVFHPFWMLITLLARAISSANVEGSQGRGATASAAPRRVRGLQQRALYPPSHLIRRRPNSEADDVSS